MHPESQPADGELQFTLPDVLKVPPISQHGNVAEIIGKFGGTDRLRNAHASCVPARDCGNYPEQLELTA